MCYKNTAVFIETKDGKIKDISLELLGEARKLSDVSHENVVALVLGDNVIDIAHECVFYGADEVYYVDSEYLREYNTEPYTQAICSIIKELKPNIFLVGATHIGRDLAPRISARLKTGLTADCTKLRMKTIDVDDKLDVHPDKLLLMTRPTFGDNLIATILCERARPQMATVRANVMDKATKDTSRHGIIEEKTINFDINACKKVEILETIIETSNKKSIIEENVIVSGGRGIKRKKNFENLFKLASLLDAGVGVARSLVQCDWAEYDMQVGQTGKTVRPSLYLAFGISGAIQHITGMENADFIIAVNLDRNAPIFKFSDIGLVCDLEKVIPLLIDEFSEIKKS